MVIVGVIVAVVCPELQRYVPPIFDVPLAVRVEVDQQFLGEAMILLTRDERVTLINFTDTRNSDLTSTERDEWSAFLSQGVALGSCKSACPRQLQSVHYSLADSMVSLVTANAERDPQTRQFHDQPEGGSVGLIVRNQFASAAVVFAFVALIAALGISIFMARNANAQAEKAAAVKNFMLNVFAASDPDATHAANVSVRELLDTSAEQMRVGSIPNLASAEGKNEIMSWQGEPEVRAEIQTGIAAAYANLGEFSRALRLLDDANAFPSASGMLTRARALRGGDRDCAQFLPSARPAGCRAVQKPVSGHRHGDNRQGFRRLDQGTADLFRR